MSYVEGFVTAVPEKNREVYRAHAEGAVQMFRDGGMTRFVECWGTDVPEGKLTDFRRAVQAEPDEAVLFSWIEYPDRATRDRANSAMSEQDAAEMMKGMPFDGSRMIWSGFEIVSEAGPGGVAGYVDGICAPAPGDGRAAFTAVAQQMAPVFVAAGALRVVDAWGDDLMQGKKTDYPRAVAAEPGENVIYSWIEWPSRAVRDAAWEKLMADGAMPGPDQMPFCMKRMIYGGFEPIVQQ